MKELKKYLTINSAFSALSGLTMLIISSKLNDLFNIDNAYVFPIIGANLLVFSAFVLFVAKKQLANKTLVNIITTLDFLWVLGSIVLLVSAFLTFQKLVIF